jgi:hypothetical protein
MHFSAVEVAVARYAELVLDGRDYISSSSSIEKKLSIGGRGISMGERALRPALELAPYVSAALSVVGLG